MADLFQNVPTASFHGSIVIAAILLLRLVLKKAPRKFVCMLWLLAFLRLLMPFEIQSQLSLQPEPVEMASQLQSQRPDLNALPKADRPDAPMLIQQEQSEAPEQPQSSPTADIPAEADPVTIPATDPVTEPVSLDLLALLPWLWFAVACGFGIYTMASYLRLKSLVWDAVKIPGGWESDKIETAFILGFVRPRIYIPVGMKPAVRRHILAHERTHLEKGDHWYKLLGFVALAIHWFNPLVWAAYICLCKDIEMACDERVVQFMELPERKSYAAALLSCSANRVHYGACPVAFGETSVKERIKSVLSYKKPSFWVSLLAVLAVLFVSMCLLTNPPGEEPEEIEGTPAVQAEISQKTETPEALSANKPPMGDAIDPGWGLKMEAEATSATEVTLRLGLDQEVWDGTPLSFGWEYWIEQYDGEKWVKLPILVENPTWEGSFASELSYENNSAHGTAEAELDFSLIFGSLSAGDYRIGKDIKRENETVPHYAWFRVYANELSGEEKIAFDRCRDALSKITEQNQYYVTVSETNGAGELWPVYEIIKAGGMVRKDFYKGDMCINTAVTEVGEYPIVDWDGLFGLDGNMHISFPEGASAIGQREVRFRGQWFDMDGAEHIRDFRYCFADNGVLESIEWTTRKALESVQPHRKTLTVHANGMYSTDLGNLEERINSIDTYQVKDTHEAMEESPWDIFFRIDDDLLEKGRGELWLATSADYAGKVTTNDHYWLEQRVGSSWRVLEGKAALPGWTDETYTLGESTMETGAPRWVDWSELYGELSPGFYRMGKNFYLDGDSISQYAEFQIIADGTISGEGGEEAIARVNAALDKLRSGNYHINHYYMVEGYHQDYFLQSAYWKHGGTYLWDVYDDQTREYSHTVVDYSPEEDHWSILFTWEGQQRILFPRGASKISDEEISFIVAYGNQNLAYMHYVYNIYFDENGDIESMLVTDYADYVDGPHVTKSLFVIEPTPDADIQAWVEKVMEEKQ